MKNERLSIDDGESVNVGGRYRIGCMGEKIRNGIWADGDRR